MCTWILVILKPQFKVYVLQQKKSYLILDLPKLLHIFISYSLSNLNRFFLNESLIKYLLT